MRGEFLDLDGQRLYCYAAGTRGAGEPVVFLHGFPTSSHLWNDVVRLMPAGHRLVVLDHLGYGRSDRPGGGDLSVTAHARRVLGVLDTLQIPRACLVGHDLGGAVAQWLAVHAAPRVTALALVNSVGLTAWPRRWTRLARALLPVARVVPAPLVAGQCHASLLPGFADRDDGRHALDVFLRPFTDAAGRRALLQHLAAQTPRDTATIDLTALRQPTVVVHGARDPFVPLATARRLQGAIAGATLDVIADARHFTPLDAPDRVATAVAGVLARSAASLSVLR